MEAARLLGMTPLAFRQLVFRACRRLQAEFRRLGGTVPGVVLVPVRWIKRWAGRVEERMNTLLGPRSPQLDAWLSPVAGQFVAGTVALLLVLGGSGANGPSEESRDPPAPIAAGGTAGGVEDRPRLAPGGGEGSGGGGAETPREQATRGADDRAGDRVREAVGEFTDPHRDVRQPEDARITSAALSPNFERDGTVYAAGYVPCRTNVCPHVLFRSTDHGATWTRLPAAQYFGETLLLPPGFGTVDKRIFAMGPAGLQVSEDGGETFRTAAAAGPPAVTGSAAISPAFNQGDPTILIGAQTLMRYRDDLRTVEAVPSSAAPGPLEPAFAPGYPEDGRLVIGGIRFDPVMGKVAASVYTCKEAVCSGAPVSADNEIPRVRLTADYGSEGLLHAFTSQGIFVSRNWGGSFARVPTPWRGTAVLWDLAVGRDGRNLYAAVGGVGPRRHPDAGLYLSSDGGGTWRRAGSPLLRGGARVVTLSGNVVLVGLGDRGVACSRDGGTSWSRRCRQV